MQPVLDIHTPHGFDLWPVAEIEPFGFLSLGGRLSPAEVGTALMRIAGCNDIDPDGDRPPRPADALGSFLHGLPTFDRPFAPGGLRVDDDSTGVAFLPAAATDWRAGASGKDSSTGADRILALDLGEHRFAVPLAPASRVCPEAAHLMGVLMGVGEKGRSDARAK